MVRCSKKLSVTTPGVLAGMEFPRGSYYVNVAPGTTCEGAVNKTPETRLGELNNLVGYYSQALTTRTAVCHGSRASKPPSTSTVSAPPARRRSRAAVTSSAVGSSIVQ